MGEKNRFLYISFIVFDLKNVSAVKFAKIAGVIEVQMPHLPYGTNYFIVKKSSCLYYPMNSATKQRSLPETIIRGFVLKWTVSSSIKIEFTFCSSTSSDRDRRNPWKSGGSNDKGNRQLYTQTRGYVAMVTYPFSHEKGIWALHHEDGFLALKQSTFHCTGKHQVETTRDGPHRKNRWTEMPKTSPLKRGIQST